jgi:TRAP-type mannitol/chloroaromatic compound transport system permease large subunit
VIGALVSAVTPRPRPPGEWGSEKATAAMTPNLAAAVLVLVYAGTAYFGIGEMPTGVAVQNAVGLVVLGLIGRRLTWRTPNSPPAAPAPAEEERDA